VRSIYAHITRRLTIAENRVCSFALDFGEYFYVV